MPRFLPSCRYIASDTEPRTVHEQHKLEIQRLREKHCTGPQKQAAAKRIRAAKREHDRFETDTRRRQLLSGGICAMVAGAHVAGVAQKIAQARGVRPGPGSSGARKVERDANVLFAAPSPSFVARLGQAASWFGGLFSAAPPPHISNMDLLNVIASTRQVYEPIAAKQGLALDIDVGWDDPTENAWAKVAGGAIQIRLGHGLTRVRHMTVDALVLVLCHELGHALGGPPYINSQRRQSSEGQADYYAAGVCAKRVLRTIATMPSIKIDSGIERDCSVRYGTGTPDSIACGRIMQAGLMLGRWFASKRGFERAPSYNTPDRTVVTYERRLYPETAQCRVDTFRHGALALPRPRCWHWPWKMGKARDEDCVTKPC